MKANNDDIKCHLQKKTSSCVHYGYVMDCLMVTLQLLSGYAPLLFFKLCYMVKC